MKSESKIIKLKGKSRWSLEADFRLQNSKWLRYSSRIARRILYAIDREKPITQKSLAESLNVSPQYISKVLSGRQNLSLSTIAKLSEILGIELISFPEYGDNLKSFKIIDYNKEGYFVPTYKVLKSIPEDLNKVSYKVGNFDEPLNRKATNKEYTEFEML